MHVQPSQRRFGDRTMKPVYHFSSIHAITKKRNRNRIMRLLSKFNPSNWFNEFRNIEITLEEFGKSKEAPGCELRAKG